MSTENTPAAGGEKTTTAMATTSPAAVAKAEPKAQRAPMAIGERGVHLGSLEDAFRFANAVHSSEMAPKGLDSPEKILIAIQTGMEAGLTPMAALRSVVVINGLPSWKGDQALALVRSSGKLLFFDKRLEGEGDARRAVVVTQRVGQPQPVETSFSVQDAKTAKLWGKRGRDGQDTPWTTYPDRMLYYRALGFALRDYFSDVLAGIAIAEEEHDRPAPTSAVPEPQRPPTMPAPPARPDPLLTRVLTPPAESIAVEARAVEPEHAAEAKPDEPKTSGESKATTGDVAAEPAAAQQLEPKPFDPAACAHAPAQAFFAKKANALKTYTCDDCALLVRMGAFNTIVLAEQK